MAQVNLVFLIVSCLYMGSTHYSNASTDTIRQGQQLRDWEQLTSAGGVFNLLFYSPSVSGSTIPGASGNRYLVIWYERVPSNPVWVANRENPIPDSSGVVTMDTNGRLKISYSGGEPLIINYDQAPTTSMSNITATLLDSGNLVTRETYEDGTFGSVLWQSFDYPTSNLLPGMKLGKNLRTGHSRSLTSWVSDQVAALGAFKLGLDPDGSNQLVVWRRDRVYWTSGVWRNGSFEKVITRRVDDFEFKFITNENEKYFSYFVKNNSTLARWELDDLGQIMQFALFKTPGSSSPTWRVKYVTPCNLDTVNLTALCLNQKPTECRNGSEMFVPTKGHFDINDIGYYDNNLGYSTDNMSLALSDCHGLCWNNCSCVAYRSLSNDGTGCQFWDEGSNFTSDANSRNIYRLTRENRKEELPKEGPKKGSPGSIHKRWWIWSVMAIAPALALLLSGFWCQLRRRKIKRMQQRGEGKTNQDKSLAALRSQIPSYQYSTAEKLKIEKRKGHELHLYDFLQIVAATDNFSSANKLGEGGFGPVYKGILPHGQQVAVKRLSRSSGQGLVEFKNEITLIAELQHVNLVRLLGCCIQGEEKILIYEYMPNKSPDSFLFDPIGRKLLDWKRRLSIIEGIAQGLLYLHKYSRMRVIHRDLKASNILLDDEMNPKISDFGMARIFGQNESEANTNRVVGTYGYMSPEYAMNGIFSVKSDVFSFGVLLLEIVSGKKKVVSSHLSSHLSLIEYAWDLWEKDTSLELVDPLLGSSCPLNELLRCTHVGLLCVQDCAVDRPTMSDIITMLTNETMSLPDPKQPAFYSGRSVVEAAPAQGKSGNPSVNCVSISMMEGR